MVNTEINAIAITFSAIPFFTCCFGESIFDLEISPIPLFFKENTCTLLFARSATYNFPESISNSFG